MNGTLSPDKNAQGKFGAELAAQLGQPWPWLLPFMLRMQMPVLDPSFGSQIGSVCAVPEALAPQDIILRKLQCWFQAAQGPMHVLVSVIQNLKPSVGPRVFWYIS